MNKQLAFMDDFTPGQAVKAYTELMQISEPKLAQLLAKIEIDSSANTLEAIAQAIEAWLKKTDLYNNTGFWLTENLENQLYITVIDTDDTAYSLNEKFFKELEKQREDKAINITAHQDYECQGYKFVTAADELLVVGDYWAAADYAASQKFLNGFGSDTFGEYSEISRKAIIGAMRTEYGENTAATGVILLSIPTLVMRFKIIQKQEPTQ